MLLWCRGSPLSFVIDDAVPPAGCPPEEAKTEGESPMESMTSTIVAKIRFVARDERLFGHVLCMPVPPQLYFAKWVRLMFGRELGGGMKNVLRLWDGFFDLASARATARDDVPVTVALLDVLQTAGEKRSLSHAKLRRVAAEVSRVSHHCSLCRALGQAASMILLIRHELLAPTVAPDGTLTGEPDPNNGIGYLMNYPALQDASVLVNKTTDLLNREQKLSYHCQSIPSKSHEIPSITEHPLEMQEKADDRDPPLRANRESPSWVPKEESPTDDQCRDFVGNDRDELPPVHRPGKNPPVPPQMQHVGGLLLDFGAKTVDFGTKTASMIKKTYEDHRAAVMDHPLKYDDKTSPNEFAIEYRPNVPDVDDTATQERVANVMQVPIGAKISVPLADDISDCGFIDSVDDFSEAGSVASSKLSISKVVGDSLQKRPEELASILEKSVATLMKHFNDSLGGSHHSIGSSQHSSPVIPDEIYHAMADIDRVRKELLTQAALASMSDTRSCSSSAAPIIRSELSRLRSSGTRGRRRGTPPWHM